MIKKIILWLFVWFVWFIGFSNAWKVQEIWLDSYSSIYDSNYMITFLKWWWVLSNYLWTAKSVLALNSNTFFWRTTEWSPYFYSPWFQWFFSQYMSCDEFTGWVTSPTNCSSQSLTWDYKVIFKNFFNNIKAWDYAFYNYSSHTAWWVNCWYRNWWVVVCFSSSEIHKSLCFKNSYCYNWCQWGSSQCSSFCSAFWGCWWWLVNSQNLSNVTFWSINNSWIWYAPWNVWYNWWEDPIPNWDLTNISCPTVSQLIDNYNKNWYYSWLCYSSSKIFDWSSFVSVEPKSIFELFSSKDDFISSLNKFATYCESSVYNTNVCSEAFSWEDLRFNLISKIPDTSVLWWRKSLYTYCWLYNYDPNATTCVASWVLPDYWSDYTVNDVIQSISDWNYSVYSPVTNNTEYNTVFNNWSWYIYSGDIITNIQALFWKFTSLFKQQTSNTRWMLPEFIIIPFIIIVLFKLFKK